MTERLFELIFSGELVSGMPTEQVQANVAQLFKASPAQIAQLFSGKRVILKNSLPIATGKKYLAAMKKAGALCQLVDMESGEIFSEQAAPTAPIRPTAAPQPAATTATPSAPAPEAPEKPAAASASSTTAQTGTNPSTEPGSEYRVGGRPDLDAPAWGVAPSGSQIQDEKEEIPVAEPDTDYLSLAPQKGNIVEPDDTPPPPAPDTSHLHLADENNNSSNK